MTWYAAHLLHVSPETFWARFLPLRRHRVTWPALRHSRHWYCRSVVSADLGSSRGGRRVTIIEAELKGPAMRDPTVSLPVPPARDPLVEAGASERWGKKGTGPIGAAIA